MGGLVKKASFGGVFDGGGDWPSGTVGVNAAGHSAVVVNHAQLGQLVGALHAGREAQTVGGGSVTNFYGVTSPDDIVRELDRKEARDRARQRALVSVGGGSGW